MAEKVMLIVRAAIEAAQYGDTDEVVRLLSYLSVGWNADQTERVVYVEK